MAGLMTYWSISSMGITKEAEKMGLKVEIISKEKNTFFIKGNNKEILFKSSDFGGNSSLGMKLTDDKELTYSILERNNLPVAKTWYVKKEEINNINNLAIDFPVIIKPISEGSGNGVMMNILDFPELIQKLKLSFKKYDKMIIQKQIDGDEARVLVLNGEIIIAYIRTPPSVVGNGKDSIKGLIEQENISNPSRGEGYKKSLSFIKIDDELIGYIEKHGYNIDSIPKVGQKIQLRGNSNTGTGGGRKEITDIISKDIQNICIKVSEIFGLKICGVDLICRDYKKNLSEVGGIILEINPTPGTGGGTIDTFDTNIPKKILEKLFF